MAARAVGDARRGGACLLLLVFFFVFVVIIFVDEVAIFSGLSFVFLVVLFVRIIGDEVQVDGMRLRDFEFIDIDFGGTFRATDHGSTLRIVVCKVGVRGPYPPLCSVLYTAAYEVNSRAWRHCFERHCIMDRRTLRMTSSREYPERPMVGIGGVIIDQGRTLLIRRGSEPLRGEWSIPGGTLELGETLEEGVVRELLEETGIKVRVIEIIEVFDRIYADDGTIVAQAQKKPRFHYVIVDYLCERIEGDPRAGSDVTDVAFAREEELSKYRLTETATRILKKAFAMDRARRAAK